MSGIIRRVDDLGRVVIPKEIRRSLRIAEGDPMEITLNGSGYILLKKYNVVNSFHDVASNVAISAAEALGLMVCITDMDRIVASSDSSINNKEITEGVKRIIKNRKVMTLQNIFTTTESGDFDLCDGFVDWKTMIINPITLVGEEPIGSIIVISRDGQTVDKSMVGAVLGASMGFFMRGIS